MTKHIDPQVLNSLLKLNPWVDDLWKERVKLIEQNDWNLNSMDQAGNEATRHWLTKFFVLRSQNTLELLTGSTELYLDWAKETYAIAYDKFSDEAFANAHTGTPTVPIKHGFGLNWDDKVEGYSVGQLKADVLLLGRSSLRGATISSDIDFEGKTFPIGLDITGAKFLDSLAAKGVGFGPFSAFETATFSKLDLSDSVFFGSAQFTMAKFSADTDFSRAVFKGPASFDAASFEDDVCFCDCHFEASAQYCGVDFKSNLDFSRATFDDYLSLGDSNFGKSPSFDGAVFNGKVYSENGYPYSTD